MLLASAGVAVFCVGRPRTPPSILLITLDTTRADRLGAYGYRGAATPRLDRLAREGVLFERAVTAAPITLPAHVSLFTGAYPFAHGVRNNGNFSLGETTPTLTTALHDRGYRTAAFVSAFVLDRRYGLARGFDEYDDHVQLERRGDRTAAAAGAWLDAQAHEPAPFFVWLHLYDPHDPYDPPPPFREAFAASAYDGEIAFTDQVVGSVLDRLDRIGRLSSTIVAVIGDHGESLGEHGEDTHAVFVYESTLRVPMILAWPGHLPAAARVSALVRAIDLAPTLLDLAGLPPLGGAQGRTLGPLVDRRAGAVSPASAYAESYFPLFSMEVTQLSLAVQDQSKLRMKCDVGLVHEFDQLDLGCAIEIILINEQGLGNFKLPGFSVENVDRVSCLARRDDLHIRPRTDRFRHRQTRALAANADEDLRFLVRKSCPVGRRWRRDGTFTRKTLNDDTR